MYLGFVVRILSLGFVFRIGPKPGLWAGSSADAESIQPRMPTPPSHPPPPSLAAKQQLQQLPPWRDSRKPAHPPPSSAAKAAAAAAAAAAVPSSLEGVAPSTFDIWQLLQKEAMEEEEEEVGVAPLQKKMYKEDELINMVKQQAVVQLQTS